MSERLKRIADQWASWHSLRRGDVGYLIAVAQAAHEWQRNRDNCDSMELQGRVCGSEYVDAGNGLIAAELVLRRRLGGLAATEQSGGRKNETMTCAECGGLMVAAADPRPIRPVCAACIVDTNSQGEG